MSKHDAKHTLMAASLIAFSVIIAGVIIGLGNMGTHGHADYIVVPEFSSPEDTPVDAQFIDLLPEETEELNYAGPMGVMGVAIAGGDDKQGYTGWEIKDGHALSYLSSVANSNWAQHKEEIKAWVAKNGGDPNTASASTVISEMSKTGIPMLDENGIEDRSSILKAKVAAMKNMGIDEGLILNHDDYFGNRFYPGASCTDEEWAGLKGSLGSAEKAFNKGKPVLLSFHHDERLGTVFHMAVLKIKTEGDTITLTCYDSLNHIPVTVTIDTSKHTMSVNPPNDPYFKQPIGIGDIEY